MTVEMCMYSEDCDLQKYGINHNKKKYEIYM